ncbi:MAG: hypothetical protein Satyrvirus17_3 [Satyrvirus sp.]|uniref:Uncharacterized protein n=1 Tax=Satyrvirus sp. TaxID=2487771 RepID=A0A3G5AI26_9VIRU|nr:MAG: hypothetical protein Satyrvirus17_3 [Satyrvirus sp.]
MESSETVIDFGKFSTYNITDKIVISNYNILKGYRPFDKNFLDSSYPDFQEKYIIYKKFLEQYPPENNDVLNSFHNFDDYIMVTTEISKLIDYFNDISYYQKYHGNANLFGTEIAKLNSILDFLKQLSAKFDTCITIGEDEINGYNIGKYKLFYICYDDFLDMEYYWKKEDIPYEEFKNRFEDTACTEWNKMDKYGECFGSYWKYPEGSYEWENAFDLCEEENCRALYELPYPKQFLLYTVRYGCRNRLECVEYSNFLGEYMKRLVEKFSQNIC